METFTINNSIQLLVLLLFATHITSNASTITNNTKGLNMSEMSIRGKLIPVRSTVYRVLDDYAVDGGGRRRLEPFQLCLACKCCAAGSDPNTCTTMPCCFGIDCQLPNKPFGVCAFVPKTCNCTSCGI